jgi:hypothetical protein
MFPRVITSRNLEQENEFELILLAVFWNGKMKWKKFDGKSSSYQPAWLAQKTARLLCKS